MKQKYLTFAIQGYARVPIEDVCFTCPSGDLADPKVVGTLSAEDIMENINNGDLNFDWLSMYDNDQISNLELLDIDVEDI